LDGGVGNFGTIEQTSDMGAHWNLQKVNSQSNFESVFFIDSLSGWVVGGEAFFTVDGGCAWEKDTLIDNVWLTAVHFLGNKGWIVGNRGKWRNCCIQNYE
jgi:photosystem II stability/assembly factor-like uncharacterized protein